jgi:tRNA G10  N-methylase Trm11
LPNIISIKRCQVFQADFRRNNFQVKNIDAIITDSLYEIREKVASDCLMTFLIKLFDFSKKILKLEED